MANIKPDTPDAVPILLVATLFCWGALAQAGVSSALMQEEVEPRATQQGFMVQETPRVLPFSPSLELFHAHSSVASVTTIGDMNLGLSAEDSESHEEEGEEEAGAGDDDEEDDDIVVPALVIERQHQHLPPGYGTAGRMGARNHHGCPPRPQDGYVTWRSDNRVVRATLPHMVPSSCSPPLKCSVSTTVHRRIFLQDGDTLEILLQAPPDYHPPTEHPLAEPLDPQKDPRPFTPSETSAHAHEDMVPAFSQSTPLDTSTTITTAAETVQTTTEELDRLPKKPQKQYTDPQQQYKDPQAPQHYSRQQQQQQLSKIQKEQERQQQQQQLLLEEETPTTSEDTLTVPQKTVPQRRSKLPKSLPSSSSSMTHMSLVNNHTHIFSRENHHLAGGSSTSEPERKSVIESHPLTNRQKRHTLLGGVRGRRNNLLRNSLLWSGTGLLARNRQKKHQQNHHSHHTRIQHGGWNEEGRRPRRDLEEDEEEEEEEEEAEGLSRYQLQGTADLNQTSQSPLTIWKVSVSEWASCSTREGGQVAESGPEGVVTLLPHILQPGTNYFIGRSSWSSSECFKLSVTVRSAECGEGSLCSGKGTCLANTTMEHFQCRCCDGYTGSHCEELDACIDGPCLNSGICIDIQEGHDGRSFECLCPYGYRGRFCETRTNHCESTPCQNGGTCEGNHSSYTCYCPPAWLGPQCTEPMPTQQQVPMGMDEDPSSSSGCSSNPCIHGVCVESAQHDFRCFCQPGYGGNRCEFEYNECESNPCQNGGTCVDDIGRYQCLCGRGYEGKHCQNKRNLCDPDPCPNSRVCVDKGNSYSCECLQGISDDDCEPHTQVCVPNPCENGGTCWNVAETHVFFCACRPGFTGNTCTSITQELPEDERLSDEVEGLGTVEPPPLDIHMPLSIQLHHMKNLYVAAATLAAALLIVAVVVGACHCRVNRTYRKCLVKLPRAKHMVPSVRRPRPSSLLDKASSLMSERSRERSGAHRLESDPDGAAVPMTSSANSDTVYYNMDVCDNQELPLIK